MTGEGIWADEPGGPSVDAPILPFGTRSPFGSPDPPRCQHCGDVIGVYEPYVRVSDDDVLVSSRAADPDGLADGLGYHLACYAGLEP